MPWSVRAHDGAGKHAHCLTTVINSVGDEVCDTLAPYHRNKGEPEAELIVFCVNRFHNEAP